MLADFLSQRDFRLGRANTEEVDILDRLLHAPVDRFKIVAQDDGSEGSLIIDVFVAIDVGYDGPLRPGKNKMGVEPP